MAVHDKLNKLIEKYGSDNEESLVEHLKANFQRIQISSSRSFKWWDRSWYGNDGWKNNDQMEVIR